MESKIFMQTTGYSWCWMSPIPMWHALHVCTTVTLCCLCRTTYINAKENVFLHTPKKRYSISFQEFEPGGASYQRTDTELWKINWILAGRYALSEVTHISFSPFLYET